MFGQGYGRIALAGLLLGTCLGGTAGAAGKDTILYSFKDSPDGSLPSAGLIADGAGGYFGTTERGGAGSCPITNPKEAEGCGTVFRLTPPAKGKAVWTETVLYSFKGHADGALPIFGLLRVAGGLLYGTTVNGGTGACPATSFTPSGCGTAFRLTPPADGKTLWTEAVLYSFKAGLDGSAPGGSLIAGPAGSLYGATISGGNSACKAASAEALLIGCGTAFKLIPPAAGKTAWTETILYRFRGGTDGSRPGHKLIADTAGSLYGATQYGGANKCPDTTQPGCGTVFKLTPPPKGKTVWTEAVLHDFKGGTTDGENPQTELTAVKIGGFYGTTSAGGRGTCSQSSGAAGCGTIFELTPPAKGKTVWTEAVLYDFKNAANDGSIPVRGVTPDTAGNLYGTTGSAGGPSVVFKLAPPAAGKTGWTETSLYSFKPLGSGTDGSSPIGNLLIAGNDLIGTTLLGGAGCISCGTVFEVAK